MPFVKRSERVSLYLHVPFCAARCTYCAFNTYTHLDHLIEPFTEALAREITIVGSSRPGIVLGTIFFGGGTPSMLTPAQFHRLFEAIHAVFALAPDAEISLEANPVDCREPYLRDLRHVGFSRISIGMQSAIQSELTLFNRRHTNDDVAAAVRTARRAGFDNINLDLIFGTPGQTLADWSVSLEQMLHLRPEHVSLYALTLEEQTPMKAWVDKGKMPAPDDDAAADMYEFASERLATAGYEQYEISNWCQPGYACRHNLQYWLNDDYLGVGPGAHGWAGGVRYATLLSPHRYIEAMRAAEGRSFTYPHTPATVDAVVTAREDAIAETLLMGLRLTQRGIVRAEFAARFGEDLLAARGGVLERFARHGLLEITPDAVRLTSSGRLLANQIMRELV
jgi:oxygen-independent coproporphyrinogen-3 oxidase